MAARLESLCIRFLAYLTEDNLSFALTVLSIKQCTSELLLCSVLVYDEFDANSKRFFVETRVSNSKQYKFLVSSVFPAAHFASDLPNF